MVMYIPRSKITRPDVETNIAMLSWISRSFLTDTTLPIFRREDLVVIRMDPWCASGKYNLMSYACGSSIPESFGLSMLSKTSIHRVFSLSESHSLMTATTRSRFFSFVVVLSSVEDGYSLCRRLAIPAKLCFNVSSFLPFSQRMAE